jgi:hypothetical protein
MSRIQTLFAFVILSFRCTNALADIFVADNTSSGYYDSTGYHGNGNSNYYSGDADDGPNSNVQLNDYFTFDLSGVSGTIVSATFNVFSSLVTGSGTYSIYTTSLTPAGVGGGCGGCVATYNDLTSGSLIGSISVTPADTGEILMIDFNTAGLAWLTANEGTGIVLGGSEPQPPNSYDAVFSGSGFTPGNNLTITTAVPEPTSVLLLGSAVLAAVMVTRRKLSHKLRS